MDLLDWQNEAFPEWGSDADDLTDVVYDDPNPNNFSLKRLFPIIYSKDPVAGGKFIERGLFNGILRALTATMHNNGMLRGTMPFSSQYSSTRGYPLGARCLVLYDTLTGTLTNPERLKNTNTDSPIDNISYEERRAFCETVIIESMKDENKDDPFVPQNLFKTWRIDDGRRFGDLLWRGVNTSDDTFAPPGYLDLGYSPPQDTDSLLFNIADYPRVGTFLKLTGFKQCSYFKMHGSDKFEITNLSGLFARVYNNNYLQSKQTPRDPGRTFDEIQDDAACPVTGAVSLLGYTSIYGAAYGSLEHQVIRAAVWMPVTQLSEEFADDPKYAHFKDLGKYNALKPIRMPTNYMAQQSSESYQNYGYDYSTYSTEGLKQLCGHVLTIDTSDHPKTAHEVRPKNFAVKLYIKL